jgi:hypothetical protein
MPDMDTSKPSSIHHFRTNQYRVFMAEPYFKLDLEEEIDWHEQHLRKLRVQAKAPHLFHKERTSQPIDEHRERHFQEHVIESIPFHEKILSDHQRRLKAMLEIMPKKQYKKLHEISLKLDSVADYFVFDRINKDFFFVVDKPTPEKEKWSRVVERKNLSKVLFLE